MPDKPMEIRNGDHFKAPAPFLHEAIAQWMEGDVWVLMSMPYATRSGRTAQMPIADPDESGKIFYTQAELAHRLSRYRWKKIEPARYASCQCQTCGAEIGWVGRFFQLIMGCALVQSRSCTKWKG